MTVPATERGRTTVAPRAVRRIAERAAGEALPDGSVVTRGSASVRGASARVSLGVRLLYPVRADEAAGRVREHAQTRTASLTGLSVPRTDIRIDALSVLPAPPARQPADGEPPTADDPACEAEHLRGSVGKGGRIRAQRRVPAAVTAAVGAAGCALLLVDFIAVRLGSTPATWRIWLVDWASTHGPADTAVRVGGVLAALIGLWLLGCALLPGLRRGLEMTVPTPRLRAALDRTAAARVVQDRTTAVPGVVRARVNAGRRRLRVLAEVGFGDPDQVEAEVVRVVGSALPELGLTRTPTPRVRIRVRPRGELHGQPPSPEEPRVHTAASTASASASASAERKEV
ncbi:DUF6286 domain-containing Asp23/Gls24 family envelope stress response protein [Streptomyces griseus]|uniref:DUF6286 domain-containing Asp23/Gls24 family envelope stress response protein n=1 Tax=Streptomyces griseus TaxID=1911 RepID=UPI00403D3D5E